MSHKKIMVSHDEKWRVLLTGSTGFIGQALVPRLIDEGYDLCCATRSQSRRVHAPVVVGEIDSTTEWAEALSGVSVVVHLAARAHVMTGMASDPLAEFRRVNVDGTLNLAKQVARAGVKRFIYMSSVKVHGESTEGAAPYKEVDDLSPQDAYGVSKMEAEEGLRAIAADTGLEIVTIRPPIVYGPGVKANFLSLLKLAATGLPLPFGLVKNKRSMIFSGNLVDFITLCVKHPAAADQVFLVSDMQDVSLLTLVQQMRSLLGLPSRLVPVPLLVFTLAGALFRRKNIVARLTGDLRVDCAKANSLLGWSPPFSLEDGLARTIDAYCNRSG